MSSQTRSSQGSNARGRGRQAIGRVFALTPTKPEEDALLVEGMILVYSTWVRVLSFLLSSCIRILLIFSFLLLNYYGLINHA